MLAGWVAGSSMCAQKHADWVKNRGFYVPECYCTKCMRVCRLRVCVCVCVCVCEREYVSIVAMLRALTYSLVLALCPSVSSNPIHRPLLILAVPPLCVNCVNNPSCLIRETISSLSRSHTRSDSVLACSKRVKDSGVA